MMIATENVVTDWNNVVKRTGQCKKNDYKRQRKNDRAVVSFHQSIHRVH
jgi:hypothetical protein